MLGSFALDPRYALGSGLQQNAAWKSFGQMVYYFALLGIFSEISGLCWFPKTSIYFLVLELPSLRKKPLSFLFSFLDVLFGSTPFEAGLRGAEKEHPILGVQPYADWTSLLVLLPRSAPARHSCHVSGRPRR